MTKKKENEENQNLVHELIQKLIKIHTMPKTIML